MGVDRAAPVPQSLRLALPHEQAERVPEVVVAEFPEILAALAEAVQPELVRSSAALIAREVPASSLIG
jgi:hypothetical protein